MTKTNLSVIEQHLSKRNFLGNYESGSKEWHAARNELGVISGSEIGAILGLSPFKSAYTLWAEKCSLIPTDSVGSVAMRLGQLLEPGIRQLFIEQHPDFLVTEIGSYAHPVNTWAHANVDGIGVDANGELFILEIKHTATYWDYVPEHYRAQAFWYMYVLGVKKTIFAVVNAGRYKEYEVTWDEFEFQAILQRVTEFRQLVLDQVKPEWDGSESTFETVRALSPDIQDTREELGQLGVELFAANLKVKEAETHLTEMKSRVMDALNGAKYGTIDGVTVVTLSQRGAGKPYLTIKEGK